MSFNPYAPYGPLVESTVRIVAWNVWGRYGDDWERRQAGLEDVLVEVDPDLVCLVESWRHGATTQPELIAERLGLTHHRFVGDWEQDDWVSGVGVVSRWPMGDPMRRDLVGEGGAGFGQVVHVVIDGPRGPLQLFIAMLDYPLDASARRQTQTKELATFISAAQNGRYATVLCGDFNAGPDSDEIGMLTGRSATAAPAWSSTMRGRLRVTEPQASPGRTTIPSPQSVSTPTAASITFLSAWPRAGGVGHPVRCGLLGVRAPHELQLSDHYGVVADLRY